MSKLVRVVFLPLLLLGSCLNDKNNVASKSSRILADIENVKAGTWEPVVGHPVIVSFVDPECEHCLYQTDALLKNIDSKPNDLHLAFLSDVHQDSLKAFANQFVYDTTTTVFLWDEGGKIAQEMGVTGNPTMFLYDTAGVHLQTIVGEAKPSYVYKFFNATH